MSEYSKLKVTELKELLEKRGLATNGKKDDLISRLTAADAEASSGADAKVEAHLAPPEDEFDWEGDLDDGAKKDIGDAAPAPTATAAAAGVAGTEQAAQPAGESKNTEGAPATSAAGTTESNTNASTTADAADPSIAAPAAEEKPKEDFSAHLAATKVSDELEKRKARAARFGITVDDSVKLLERGLRFSSGTEGAAAGEGDSKVVKGLDEALGDGRGRKRGHGGQGGGNDNKGGNDRKRSRGNDGGNQRRQQGQQGGGRQQQQQRGSGGGGGGQSKPKGIMSDPVEKAKAEARAKRFG